MSLSDVLRDAIADLVNRGYESQTQLEDWMSRIRRAAEEELVPEDRVEAELRRVLGAVYERMIDRGTILQHHPGVQRFTVERIKPAARAELSRSIFASANLIRLNRDRAVEDTIQRFAGWASSIPRGGSPETSRREVLRTTRSEMRKLAFQARRVGIDQGHRFAANLDRVLAKESGAVCAIWHHHFVRYPRHAHTERDGNSYLIRDSWAYRERLTRPNSTGFWEDLDELPGQAIMCRCSATYYSSIRRLPESMLTRKGREYLDRSSRS